MTRAQVCKRRPARHTLSLIGGLAFLITWGTARAGEEPPVHEVQPGESLWAIAANTIGDPTLWPALYRANRDQIKDPRLLYPGQRLAIPRVEPAQRAEVRREAVSLTGK